MDGRARSPEVGAHLARQATGRGERRKQRLLAAEVRLFGVDEDTGLPLLRGLADLLQRSRRAGPLTRDECIVVALGCLPEDFTPERIAERE
jgi:hypothetical protein